MKILQQDVLGPQITSVSLDRTFSQVLNTLDPVPSCGMECGGQGILSTHTGECGEAAVIKAGLCGLCLEQGNTCAFLTGGVSVSSIYICTSISPSSQGRFSPMYWTAGLEHPACGSTHSLQRVNPPMGSSSSS